MNIQTKNCIKCLINKKIENFSFRNDTKKYYNECKICMSLKRKEKYNNKKIIKKGNKTCERCLINKKIENFPIRKCKYMNNCNQCILLIYKENDKQYRDKNKDKIKIQKTQYRDKNKDKIKIQKIQYRKINKERIRENSKIYTKQNRERIKIHREKNKERIRENSKIYREKNKERIREKGKIYREQNIDKLRETELLRKKKRYWNQPKCISCEMNIGNPKFDNYCYNCFKNFFPNDKRCKSNRLRKQNYIHENIIMNNELFKENLYSYDIQIDSECSSRKRPDWMFDMGIYSIILECDEDQHTGKNYTSCDSKRDMELMIDLGNRPIIFIRFNPDKYTSKRKTKVKGCFNEKTYIVRKTEFNKRSKKLIKVLTKWIEYNDIPEKEVTTEYLFFDDY